MHMNSHCSITCNSKLESEFKYKNVEKNAVYAKQQKDLSVFMLQVTY